MNCRKSIVLCVVSLIFLTAVAGHSFNFTQNPPNPVLNLISTDFVTAKGKDLTRYNFEVENSSYFPNALFAEAPQLPPCGKDKKASRARVDFYDSTGKKLNEFCALRKTGDLENLWFTLESDVIPPSYVYIELVDGQTNTKYKSNLAATVQ